jgi:hypothetical protein
MKTYKIPVFWQMFDWVPVEAENLDEAKEKAYSEALTIGDYVDGSFEIDEDMIAEKYPEEIRDQKINQVLGN